MHVLSCLVQLKSVLLISCVFWISILVSVSDFMALSTVFHSIILPTTLRFLTLFFGSYFCRIGPFNYKALYESLPQPRCNPLWLTGLNALTNPLKLEIDPKKIWTEGHDDPLNYRSIQNIDRKKKKKKKRRCEKVCRRNCWTTRLAK